MERVVGSVDQLFEEARPPHFLQMHSGDHDPGALGSFAEQHPDVEAWLIEDMPGYNGADLSWSRASDGEAGGLLRQPDRRTLRHTQRRVRPPP